MRFLSNIRTWAAGLLALSLVACGGGGGSGTPLVGGSTAGSSKVAGLVVTLSAASLANTGTSTVLATVTAVDSNNVALANVPVTMAANNNAIVTVLGSNGSVTDGTGKVAATVGIGSDRSNRNITITATSGAATGSAVLAVIDSPSGSVAKAVDVIAAATRVGTSGDGVKLTAFVKDANNNAMPGVAVAFRTDTGVLTSVSSVTDNSGTATATLASGPDRSNRSATVTVTAGPASGVIKLPISGTKLTIQGPSSIILGSAAAFNVVVTDSNDNPISGVVVTGSSSLGNALAAPAGNTSGANGQVNFTYTATRSGTDNLVFSGAGDAKSPVPALTVNGLNFGFTAPAASAQLDVGQSQAVTVKLLVDGAAPAPTTVNFAATGGTLTASSATTDASGLATVSVSSTSAGPITVQASVTLNGSVTSTTLPLVIVAKNPAKLVLQASRTSLPPNLAGSTVNQTQLIATVSDAVGNPVQGATVNFTRLADPSGGNLQQASQVTDASGKATVTYLSGPESTANNGVQLQATVVGTAVVGTTSLTVNQAALFIALGTGNVVTNVDPQTYLKNWVAYVTDANGIAVNGATLTIKALPTHYLTGRLVYDATAQLWVYGSGVYQCVNEDTNTNGLLDAGEDTNGDGVLWPGNVVAVSPASAQTTNGLATLSLTYAESYVPWVRLRLTASTVVAGTESKTNAEFVIAGVSDDFTKITIPPAGVVSPFGLLPTAAALATPGACVQITP